MWILVVFLSLIGLVHFTISLSLLERKTIIAIILVAIAAIPLLYHHFALQTNFKVITYQLSNQSFISNLVAIEIAILIISTFFSIDIINNHFNNVQGKIKKFLSLFPSIFFIVGIVLVQLWLFNEVSGVEYINISSLLSFALFFSLLILVFILKYLLKDWTLRLELKSLLSFLLIIGAILLPIFFQQISIVVLEKSQINYLQSIIIIGFTMAITILGFFNYQYKITENIWKRFIKS